MMDSSPAIRINWRLRRAYSFCFITEPSPWLL